MAQMLTTNCVAPPEAAGLPAWISRALASPPGRDDVRDLGSDEEDGEVDLGPDDGDEAIDADGDAFDDEADGEEDDDEEEEEESTRGAHGQGRRQNGRRYHAGRS